MSMSLDDLLRKIVSMAEKSQVQGQERYTRAEDYKQQQDKLARIDANNRQRDVLLNAQEEREARAQVANPLSSLSGQEQRMQAMNELRHRNALMSGAVTAQSRANSLSEAQATEAQGKGNYYTSFANKEKAISDMIPGLSKDQAFNFLSGRPVSPALATPSMSAVAESVPSATQYKRDVIPVPLDQAVQTPQSVAQPYTDGYMNFSKSPMGRALNLPSMNTAIQGGLEVGGDITDAAVGLGKWLVNPLDDEDERNSQKGKRSIYTPPY